MIIELSQGERITVVLKDTDGEFVVDYDSKGDSKLTVTADIADTSGRGGIDRDDGLVYCEDFSIPVGEYAYLRKFLLERVWKDIKDFNITQAELKPATALKRPSKRITPKKAKTS